MVPAYNEEPGAAHVVAELREALAPRGIETEIIVVDDESTDKTAVRAAAAGARGFPHRSNHGYGAVTAGAVRDAVSDRRAQSSELTASLIMEYRRGVAALSPGERAC